MAVELALFPLNTVLFPHMPMGLHIFESRYRRLMRDCQAQGTSFGVVAIREGFEVGAAATPYSVGTLAQLRQVNPLDDGRYDVQLSGTSRFRIHELRLERPYLTATVTYLSDTAEGATDALVDEVSEQFQRYAAQVRRMRGRPEAALELPTDPELLSYVVAATLQTETPHKQRLLEADSAGERLRGCLRLLRRERVLLDQQLTREPPQRLAVSPN